MMMRKSCGVLFLVDAGQVVMLYAELLVFAPCKMYSSDIAVLCAWIFWREGVSNATECDRQVHG